MHYSRRHWLKISSLGWLSAGLPAVLAGNQSRAGESVSRSRTAPIKSCIILFHYGGPSHFETYDPKPLAPAGVRGE